MALPTVEEVQQLFQEGESISPALVALLQQIVENAGGGAVAAEDVSFTPAGSIAATNVQDAIEEAAAESGGSQPGAPVVRYVGFAHDTPLVTPREFEVAGVNQGTRTLTVAGDVTAEVPSGSLIDMDGSTGNDGEYTVESATFDTDHTDIVVEEALPNATADGYLYTRGGRPIYTPGEDEILLEAWFEISELWDGTTPLADVSQYTYMDANQGLWKYNVDAVALDGSADSDESGGGPLGSAETSNIAASSLAVASSFSVGRVVPGRLVAGVPLRLVVSRSGEVGIAGAIAADPGASQGAARFYFVTAVAQEVEA